MKFRDIEISNEKTPYCVDGLYLDIVNYLLLMQMFRNYDMFNGQYYVSENKEQLDEWNKFVYNYKFQNALEDLIND